MKTTIDRIDILINKKHSAYKIAILLKIFNLKLKMTEPEQLLFWCPLYQLTHKPVII